MMLKFLTTFSDVHLGTHSCIYVCMQESIHVHTVLWRNRTTETIISKCKDKCSLQLSFNDFYVQFGFTLRLEKYLFVLEIVTYIYIYEIYGCTHV